MRTIEVNLYQFDELDDKAKEKAREWWRGASDGDSYWSECTIDEAVEQGKYMGIEITNNKDGRGARVYWSGFSSQGDGACFEGTWRASDCHPEKVADGWGDAPETKEIKRIADEFGRIAKKYPHAFFSVKHSGHYSHKYCTDFGVDLVSDDDSIGPDDYDPDEEKALIEVARDLMEWIYRQLERAYEDYMSDEQVDESIRINEYWFDITGKRSDI